MAHHRRLLLLTILSVTVPASAGIWIPIGPDGGAEIRRLLVDPITPTTLYASSGHGFHKSTNSGLSWTASGAGLPPGSLAYRIAIVPTAPSTLYAGIFLGASDQLYKSTDGAGSWTLLPTAIPSIRSLVVDPTTPGRLYVGSYGGTVFRSTDGGATWASAALPGSGFSVEALAADPITPGVLYAATSEGGATDGVFKSTDWGVSFSPTTLVGKHIASLAVDPVMPSTIYAAYAAYAYPQPSAPLWKSTDGGASWNPSSTGLPLLLNFDTPIVIDPTAPSTVYVGGLDGVYRSTDGGANWTLMANGLLVPRINALAIHPTVTGTLWAGTEGGLDRSTDGAGSWTASGAGILEDSLNGFVVDPTNPAVLYAASVVQGVQKSTDAAAHWSPTNDGLPALAMGSLVMNPGSNTTLHALVLDGQYVVRTLDGAATWEVTTTGLPPTSAALSLVVDPNDPAVLYIGIDADNFGGGTPGVWKSTDTGATWSPTAGPLDATIRALAIVPSSGRIYAGSENPRYVYSSDDGGVSWSSGVFVPTGVLALAVDPTGPLTVFAGTFSAGVYRSTDGGATWISPGALVGNPEVHALVLDPTTAGKIYAATDEGVQASLDGGVHWTDVSGGLTTRFTTTIALDPTVPGRLYAATIGTGAYRRDLGPCAADLDCDDANLCSTDACLPGDSASDAFGCVHVQPPCPAAGDCRSGAGTCNRDTGVCAYATRPNGTACTSDGSGCTVGTCTTGVCTHTAQITLSCRTPSVPGASVLTFKSPAPQRAALTWKWKKGDATLGELGDPFTAGGSDYDLCVFDHGGSGGSPRFLFGISAPAGGSCGTKPCWTTNGVSIKYRDKDRTPDGLATLQLKSGAPGTASFSAVVKGANLELPAAALVPGVTVQLRRDAATAVCWQGIYTSGIKKNLPGLFRAKSE